MPRRCRERASQVNVLQDVPLTLGSRARPLRPGPSPRVLSHLKGARVIDAINAEYSTQLVKP